MRSKKKSPRTGKTHQRAGHDSWGLVSEINFLTRTFKNYPTGKRRFLVHLDADGKPDAKGWLRGYVKGLERRRVGFVGGPLPIYARQKLLERVDELRGDDG